MTDTTIAVTCGSLNYLVNAYTDADGVWFTPISVTNPTADLSFIELAEAVRRDWFDVTHLARAEFDRQCAEANDEARIP